MPLPDREMEPILEELRVNFDRALSADLEHMRSALESREAENLALRSELDELKQTVELLRRIASDHEQRLQASESAPVVTTRRTASRG